MNDLVKTAHQLRLDGRELDAKRYIERKLKEEISEEDRGQLELQKEALSER
tara:strand:- start:1653 stop:1805 length:153 start_codon:yes stop_codon:yes gene_type:complete